MERRSDVVVFHELLHFGKVTPGQKLTHDVFELVFGRSEVFVLAKDVLDELILVSVGVLFFEFCQDFIKRGSGILFQILDQVVVLAFSVESLEVLDEFFGHQFSAQDSLQQRIVFAISVVLGSVLQNVAQLGVIQTVDVVIQVIEDSMVIVLSDPVQQVQVSVLEIFLIEFVQQVVILAIWIAVFVDEVENVFDSGIVQVVQVLDEIVVLAVQVVTLHLLETIVKGIFQVVLVEDLLGKHQVYSRLIVFNIVEEVAEGFLLHDHLSDLEEVGILGVVLEIGVESVQLFGLIHFVEFLNEFVELRISDDCFHAVAE